MEVSNRFVQDAGAHTQAADSPVAKVKVLQKTRIPMPSSPLESCIQRLAMVRLLVLIVIAGVLVALAAKA